MDDGAIAGRGTHEELLASFGGLPGDRRVAGPRGGRMMADRDREEGEALPSISRGAGGAGRVMGMLTDEKAEDSRATLARLLSTIKPFRAAFIGALALTLIGTLCQVAAPMLVGDIITTIARTLTSTGFPSHGTASFASWPSWPSSMS